MLRRLSVLLVAAVALLAAPTAAYADHDCGPPAKHSDHSQGPADRNNPCK